MSKKVTDAEKLRMLFWVLEDIEADPKAKFDMSTWGYSKTTCCSVGRFDEARRDLVWNTNECGTVACHAGWAVLAPYCREAGIPDNPENVSHKWFSDQKLAGRVYWELFLNISFRGSKANVISEQKRILKRIYREHFGIELRP